MKIFASSMVLVALGVCHVSTAEAEWLRFRGANGSGVGTGKLPPSEWSTEKNLKWSVPLPGKGSSSPIVTDDRVYVTCYTGYGVDPLAPGDAADLVRHLIACDRNTGKEIWRASVASNRQEDPYQGFLQQHGYASGTPVADGDFVYAFFDKSGLFAFDRDGKQVWSTSLGTKSDRAKWGGGSSPIVYGDLVVVNAGIVGNQLIAVNKKTGKEVWSLKDPGYTNCWSTPIVVQNGRQDQIVFHVPKKVIAVDPATGKKIWEADSPLDDATCASLIHNEGVVYLMGSREGNGMAVRIDGTGDVSDSHTVWKKRIRSGICTPVIVGKHLYWTTGGLFYAADLETGDYVYRTRLPRMGKETGGFGSSDYGSPVAIADNIILFTRYGESYVIEAGDEFKTSGHNPAFKGDKSSFNGTPAISNGEIFVRSDTKLYCVGR